MGTCMPSDLDAAWLAQHLLTYLNVPLYLSMSHISTYLFEACTVHCSRIALFGTLSELGLGCR